jgi:hypothetical protein
MIFENGLWISWYDCIDVQFPDFNNCTVVMQEIVIALKRYNLCWMLVAHICNPGYSGGRDQEDHSSKSAQANSSWDPISTKSYYKKNWAGGGVAQGEGPEFKSSTTTHIKRYNLKYLQV